MATMYTAHAEPLKPWLLTIQSNSVEHFSPALVSLHQLVLALTCFFFLDLIAQWMFTKEVTQVLLCVSQSAMAAAT
jgi:hypothetical protein